MLATSVVPRLVIIIFEPVSSYNCPKCYNNFNFPKDQQIELSKVFSIINLQTVNYLNVSKC